MKRIVTLFASMALIAAGFQALPAAAAEDEPTVVPEVVNIEDPAGDANYLNGQGLDETQGDNVTGQDAGSLSDILKVWFTSDAEKVNAHIQTEAAPNGTNVALYFRAMVNPNGAEDNCLRFQGMTGGLNSAEEAFGTLRDLCGDADETTSEGVEFKIETGPEDTGLFTISVPKSAHPALADGTVFGAPTAHSRNWVTGAGATAPQVDNTKPGTDFVVSSGDAGEPAKPTPPGKSNPPGKKKGCDKGKGKKRGCEGKGKKAPKPGKPSAACAPLAPATAGADAPSVKVTDAATAEKPLIQPVTLEQRFDEGITSDAVPTSVNVQVDTDLKGPVGLYATLEFPARRDYDLWAYFPGTDNEEAASSHGFNPLIDTKGAPAPADQSNTASNHGGETTATSENLVGIITPDCGGYTVTAYNYLGEGGELELKLWLGEGKTEPGPPAEGSAQMVYASVLSLF